MQVAPVSVVACFIVVAWGGCVAGSDASTPAGSDAAVGPSAGPAQFDETTGGIEGIVHDDSLAPIAGAQVAIQAEPPIGAITDAAGLFSLSHVPVGTQKLFASRLGFNSIGKSVTVEAGQVSKVDVSLTALAVVEPYHETQIVNGLFGCGTSWRPAVVYSGVAVCGALDGTPANVVEDKFLVPIPIGGNISNMLGLVFDAEWKSNQAFGAGLSFPIEPYNCSNSNRFFAPSGHSPLRARLNGSALQDGHFAKFNDCGKKNCAPEKCTLQTRAFSSPDTLGASSPADIGITIQQRFTNYLTEFYFEEGPEDFSALPDH